MGVRKSGDNGGADRFSRLFDANYSDLVRFVRRRTEPEVADDIAADAFLVAWRRLDDLPADDARVRPWLFGIARGLLLNESRSARRRSALGVRLRQEFVGSLEGPEALVAQQLDMSRAWRRLSAVHQESLGLAVLDGLDAAEAAQVLGISPVAFRLRLSRARRALRANLEHLPNAAPTAEGERNGQLA
jgi:RNA polymerase sigma-70 factor (ECF subfamily)